MKKSKDRVWNYLYKQNFPSNIEGYRPYQIRFQQRLDTGELLVSFGSGSRFMVLPYQDLDNLIMELMTLRMKLNELMKEATKQEI